MAVRNSLIRHSFGIRHLDFVILVMRVYSRLFVVSSTLAIQR
jgi:hypothetical protein